MFFTIQSVMAPPPPPPPTPWTPTELPGELQVVTKYLIGTLINHTVVIPTNTTNVVYNYAVNWGDGSPLTYVLYSGAPGKAHTYESNGSFTITLIVCDGKPGVLDMGVTGGVALFFDRIERVSNWGTPNLTQLRSRLGFPSSIPSTPLPDTMIDMIEMFYQANLTSIPSVLFDNINPDGTSISMKSMFASSSLTSIPTGLFVKESYNVPISSLESMFEGCSGIVSDVPELWNIAEYEAITHTNCFKGCVNASNYASIPNSWKGL